MSTPSTSAMQGNEGPARTSFTVTGSGSSGFKVAAEELQAAGATMGGATGMATELAGATLARIAPGGSIDYRFDISVYGSGMAHIDEASVKGYPSYEVWVYSYDNRGNLVSERRFYREEGDIDELKGNMIVSHPK